MIETPSSATIRAVSRLSRRMALATAGALPFSAVFSRRARAEVGPLVADSGGVLDLPAGFSYRILEERGADMDDGYRVPGAPDGMACFDPGDGTLVLMRNHELAIGDLEGPYKAGQSPPPQAVNPRSPGGVTRLVIDKATRDRVSSNLVLTGTMRNCAGGLSPWGWLTCEEAFQPGHGYVYLCPADATSVQPARRIGGYGRFNHEAAAVDPTTLIAYLTEDRPASCFYRFVPSESRDPFSGKLQALAVTGTRAFHTSSAMTVGVKLEVSWIDCPDPDPISDTIGPDARAAGAAIIRRGEGLWIHDGIVYFSATNGGPANSGQIFRLVPQGDGGTLELVAQSAGERMLDFPDNIAVSPAGGLVMAEDGRGENLLRGLDSAGKVFDFARNAYTGSELAGLCFSPDGQALFVNLQQDGLTLVIEGPLDEVFGAPPAPEPQPTTASTGSGAALGGGAHGDKNEGLYGIDGCGCETGPDSNKSAIAIPAAAAVAGIAWHYRRRGRGSS